MLVGWVWFLQFRLGFRCLRFCNFVWSFELLNLEIVLKAVMSELVSESMPDDVLTWGDSGGGKAKSGMMVIGFWRLAGWEMER